MTLYSSLLGQKIKGLFDGWICRISKVPFFFVALSKVFYSRAWILSDTLLMTGYTVYIYRYNIYCTPFVCIPLHALYMRHMAYLLHIQLTYTKLIEQQTCILILLCKTCHFRWTWYIQEDWKKMISSSLRVCQYSVTVVLPQKLHLINGLWLTQSLASRDGCKISLNLLQLGLWVHVPNVSGCCREWQWFVRWETYSNEKNVNLGMEVQHAMQSIMPGTWRCNFDMYFLPGDICSLMEGLSSINIMGSFVIYIIYTHIFIWFSENIVTCCFSSFS